MTAGNGKGGNREQEISTISTLKRKGVVVNLAP
jgi:hypothetical protein